MPVSVRRRLVVSIGQAFLWALLPMLVLVLSTPSVGDAQEVTTSITSTTGTGNLGTTVTQAGNLYDITGGTRPGNGHTLLHSFGDFTVGGGEIANFLNNTQLPTSNILGRITGGNLSNIYGTIQTTDFGTANLFLVNPSGIVLGPHGSVNVGGSVSFSTAQYLRLFDSLNETSANFYADSANDGLANSVLAVAPLIDFGFLTTPANYGFLTPPDQSATITVQGSALSVPSGQSISLVGGKVVIQGDTLPDGTIQSAHLSAPSGRIQLVNTTSPGEIEVATRTSLPNVDGTSFTSFGSTVLAPGSNIDVSGASTVFVKGGQLLLSLNDATLTTLESPAPQDTISLSPGSSILTSNFGTEPGADVQITVGNFQADGVEITTINSGDGAGGNISINATTVGLTNVASVLSLTGLDFITGASGGFGNGGNVMVQGLQGVGSAADSVTLSNSTITAGLFGSGTAGDVQITAGTLAMDNFSSILTGTFDGNGAGGDVVLNVGTVSLSGFSSIASLGQSFTPGSGLGGNVTIQGLPGAEIDAAKLVNLSDGSSLVTQTTGSSEGGRVAIMSKSLTMDGAGTTVNTSAFDVGRGGDIVVSVQHARLSGGATITTQTFGADLNPVEGGTVTLQGWQGSGSMADSVALSGFGSGIVSDTQGTGRSGDIAVHAKTVSLTDGAVIQAGTPSTTAAGGNVAIDAGSVGISGGSHIRSQSSLLDAGEVTITANALTLNKSSIVTNTVGPGRGGDVVLNVGTVSLSNRATIDSSTFETGRAGDVTMTVGTLSFANGSQITSASSGTEPTVNFNDGTTAPPGRAGNVTINSTGGFTSDASTVATSAEANHGGDISITAQNVQLSNGTKIDVSSNAPLQVTKLVLDENSVLVQEVVGDGNSGNMAVRSGSTFVMNNSLMTADASQAGGGKITITAPEMVWLINSRISTSVGGSLTDIGQGDITIDPQFVILQNSQILSQAFGGGSGNVIVIADVLLVDPNSILSASGSIRITAPSSLPVSGVLMPLSQEFSSAAALLLAQRCAADPTGQFSSFIQTGREGVPQIPGALSPSPLSFLETLTSSSVGSPSPNVAAARLELDSVSDPSLFRFYSACRS